jgi:uncharacterized protein (DUF305 family)
MNRILITGVSAGAVLVLAACSGGSTSHTSAAPSASTSTMAGMNMTPGTPGAAAPLPTGSAGTATEHNAADVTFAQMMIPHHAGAIDMANKEVIDGANTQVKALAKKIMAAQEPEITTMNTWLTAWKVAPSGHQGHGSMTMPGMMSDTDMAKFRTLKGAALDRSFLTLMITHHEGALQMAKAELSQGVNAQAKALAHTITTSQSAEIVTMKAMLAALPR